MISHNCILQEPLHRHSLITGLHSIKLAARLQRLCSSLQQVDEQAYSDQTSTYSQLQLEQLWILINKIRLGLNGEPTKLQQAQAQLKALSVIIQEQREQLSDPHLQRLWNNRYLVTTLAALHDLDNTNQQPSWLEKSTNA